MAKIAIIKSGGKQYKVRKGQVLRLEKLEAAEGETVKFDTLLVANQGQVEIGRPSLGEKTEARVRTTAKGKKIRVVKYKNKTRYLRNLGHRQTYTEVEINKIA